MASLFWVAGSSAYDGVTNRLATTSGGAASVAVITSGDTVTFDANSPAASAVTTSAAISCTTLTLAAGFTGSLTMSNTLTVSGTVALTQGTLNTNGQTCSWGVLSASNSNVRTLSLGSSVINLTGTGTVWTISTMTNLTFSAGTSNIVIADTGASAKVFASGTGSVYNDITITGGGAGTVTLSNTSRYNILTINAPKTIIFGAGTTKTVGGFVATGSPGNIITLQSSTAGSTWTLTKPNGISVSGDYLSLQDSTVTGGASWFAGANSTNVSNNTGWNFRATSPQGGNFFQVM